MKLSIQELSYIRSTGLYITEKCDSCKKLLNQTVRYTQKDSPGVYCSATCRDGTIYWKKASAETKGKGTDIPHGIAANSSTRHNPRAVRRK